MDNSQALPNNDQSIERGLDAIARAIGQNNTVAWTTWPYVISAGSGSFTTTSANARYIQIGKTVHFKIDVTITTIGTGSGCQFTLPVQAQTTSGAIGFAREDATSGNMGVVKLASATLASVLRYDNGNIASGGSGTVVRCAGTYEAA